MISNDFVLKRNYRFLTRFYHRCYRCCDHDGGFKRRQKSDLWTKLW